MMDKRLIKASTLRGLDRFLSERGVDFSLLEREFDIDRTLFDDDTFLIAGPLAMALLKRSAELTDCPALGIELARAQDISVLGVFGLLIETSDNLQRGIEDYCRYQQLYNPTVQWDLHFEDEIAAVCLDCGKLSGVEKRLVVDLSFGHAWNITYAASGHQLELLRVEMSSDQPAKVSTYTSFFRTPVVFQASADRLLFRKQDLRKPIPRKDDRVYGMLRKYLALTGKETSVSLVGQVRTLIKALLSNGNCSIENVARLYACDKRTLQRYLKDEGMSYQQILDEVRFELARNYMKQPDVTLTQLALLVGFTDASNFSRAFKQRFGISPRQWRKQQGLAPRSQRLARRLARVRRRSP
jgi:AraC-like DNA-binding protein